MEMNEAINNLILDGEWMEEMDTNENDESNMDDLISVLKELDIRSRKDSAKKKAKPSKKLSKQEKLNEVAKTLPKITSFFSKKKNSASIKIKIRRRSPVQRRKHSLPRQEQEKGGGS